jgi:hypothetical protein
MNQLHSYLLSLSEIVEGLLAAAVKMSFKKLQTRNQNNIKFAETPLKQENIKNTEPAIMLFSAWYFYSDKTILASIRSLT